VGKKEVGTTHNFVLSKGIMQVGAYSALVGEDGTKRLFAELLADPDRPEVRPQEVYQAILASMQPGWTLRLLQVFWPDPEPRLAFQRQVQEWGMPANEGSVILIQGLNLAVQEHPLPFIRRTILEFVLPGDEGLAWWEGLAGLTQAFGIRVEYVLAEDIRRLLEWMFNPILSQYGS